MKRLLLVLAAALLPAPAIAQVTANLPVTCTPSGICTRATAVVNPDGTNIGGGGSGGTGASANQVQGNAAAGATDTGNPAKIGGVYNSTFPTLTDGQRGNWQFDSRGGGYVVIKGPDVNGAASVGTGSDSLAAGTIGLTTRSLNEVYDPVSTNWQRMRGDTTGQYVVGNAASGATDTGNPIKFGCVYMATLPTFTDGQRGNCQITTNGELLTSLSFNGLAIAGANPGSIALTTGQSSRGLNTNGFGRYFNGTGWIPVLGDTTGAYVVSKGGASLATGQVSVTTSSTLVAAARTGRSKVTMSVGAANTCAFGNTGVTTTTGFPLAPTVGASLTLDTAAAIYAACSATTTVSFIEQY